MKIKYIITVALLVLLATMFERYMIFSKWGADTSIGNAIQSAAVFVALITAVIALSAADPKTKAVQVTIEQSVDLRNIGRYSKDDLPENFKTRYESYTDPIRSHRVQFKITNSSGFTLRKPTLTFKLPLDKQHPHKTVDGTYILSFNSNIFNSQRDLRLLEFADMRVLSNSNLPFWNDQDDITIWIRMLLDDGRLEPFNVEVSVNSENAEGITKKVLIEPRKLIGRPEGGVAA